MLYNKRYTILCKQFQVKQLFRKHDFRNSDYTSCKSALLDKQIKTSVIIKRRTRVHELIYCEIGRIEVEYSTQNNYKYIYFVFKHFSLKLTFNYVINTLFQMKIVYYYHKSVVVQKNIFQRRNIIIIQKNIILFRSVYTSKTILVFIYILLLSGTTC